MSTTVCLNGMLAMDDLVLSTGESDFAYLVGRVTEINLIGTAEHQTENDADEVHVDFSQLPYSPEREREIEEMVSKLYQKRMSIEDISLDLLIMQPLELIKITGIAPLQLAKLLKSESSAKEYCESVLKDNPATFPGNDIRCFVQWPHYNRDCERIVLIDMNTDEVKSYNIDHQMGFRLKEPYVTTAQQMGWADATDFISHRYDVRRKHSNLEKGIVVPYNTREVDWRKQLASEKKRIEEVFLPYLRADKRDRSDDIAKWEAFIQKLASE